VLTVAFSPDSTLLATAGNEFGNIRVWSVATHQRIGATMSAGRTDAYGIAFTPSGKTLVATDTDGTIRQRSVATHHQIRAPIIPRGHPHPAFGVEALSPHGKALATTQFDGPVRLWKLAAAKHA
jgi:WD40 repeat protein